jgi:tetratricopeptide (TPR) repeat protein
LPISKALDKLVNFSILQDSKIDFGSGQAYEIDSLVHLAMQTYLESGETNTLAKASTVLANTLPYPEYKHWAAWRVYLPHVTALLVNVARVEDSEASAELYMMTAYYLDDIGRYSESLILSKRARKLYGLLFGEENTKTLDAMQRMGISFQNGGRLKEAQEIQENVLEVRMRTLGEDHQDTLHSMHNLAITYQLLGGRLMEVQQIQEKVLEVRMRTLGEEHPDTVRSMLNLAITYTKLGGRLNEVQELEEKVLEVRRRTLGDDHPDTATSMQNLAATYSIQGGRLEEVKELEEVLEVGRRTFGEDHQDTADTIYNLARTLHNLERLDEAIVLMEEAACSYARTYGSDHSETKDAERVAERWKNETKQDDGGADSTYDEGAEDSDEAE